MTSQLCSSKRVVEAVIVCARCREVHTLMPSLEKHGGTAELSSSASLSKTGNFSTADMGMSPL